MHAVRKSQIENPARYKDLIKSLCAGLFVNLQCNNIAFRPAAVQ
jgi:hypothetical protein